MDAWSCISSAHFHLRAGLPGSAIQACDARLTHQPDEQVALLKTLAAIMLERTAEAMRSLEQMRVSGKLKLGALTALRLAHTKAANPDKESLREIDAEMASLQRSADEWDLLAAAEVLFLSGQTQKCRAAIERALNANGDNPQTVALSGWIELEADRDQRKAQQAFERAAAAGFPDGAIGKCRIFELRQAGAEMRAAAKELLNQNPSFLPAQLEFARACVLARDWVGASQQLHNALLVQDNSVRALELQAVQAVCINGQGIESSLSELVSAVNEVETGNHRLAGRLAGLFTRVAGKNLHVQQTAKKLLERALSSSRSPEYLVDTMRLFLSGDDAKEVKAKATELMEMDHNNPYGSLGMVIAYLMSGKAADAAAQSTFIAESNADLVNTPLLLFLQAVTARFKDNNMEKFFNGMRAAIDAHHITLQNIPFGVEFIYALDPDFLTHIALQLMEFAPATPSKSSAAIRDAERALSLIVDNCPGLAYPSYLLARCKYLSGDNESAERLLEHAVDRNDGIAEAYLLKAQIKIDKGRPEEAEQCLDRGIAFNFSVRDSHLFNLIKANVFRKSNQVERAVEQLRASLRLPDKAKQSVNMLVRREKEDTHLISVYLQLIDCLQGMGRTAEAEETMKAAEARWSGTGEEQQLVLMNAQLHVARGDPDRALVVLGKVKPGQPNYTAARTAMAEIYLEEKKDKRMFTICYKELLEHDPSPATYALLGDAYMSVQNPTKAIEVYEKALKANPKDHALAKKIGEAYVQCHLYAKAVNYYEAAVKSGRDPQMRLRLARLLFQINNQDKCERVLRDPIEKEPNPTDVNTTMAHVSYWQLLSQLHFEMGSWQLAADDLGHAKELQLKVLARADASSLIQHKREAAKICRHLAEVYMNQRDVEKAIALYKSAHEYDELDIKAMLALASIYMSQNKLMLCNQECKRVLGIDKHNDEATLMIADILYLKNEGEQAIVHFSQLLDRFANHYHALARCIELSWRAGEVDKAEKYLRRALEANPRATVDAGYNYCKGLLEWYSGEPNAGLQAFNRARRDLEWGERAIYNMIEICLNPDSEIIGGEVLDGGDEGRGDDTDREVGMTTAEKFLKELRFRPGVDSRYQLMENYILVASGNKQHMQTAIASMMEMVGEGQEKVNSVGAVLGVARAYMLLRQTPKAKAILKRVLGHPWTLEDADYLEKCWLLLADLYINQGKNEQATNILRTTLQHNQSSIKAYELMGHLREKENKHVDAVGHYEDAWRLSRKRQPAIGFKLAFNYLKCKRLFDAIEICHQVLEQCPTYPRIKKEIMDKARQSIRT